MSGHKEPTKVKTWQRKQPERRKPEINYHEAAVSKQLNIPHEYFNSFPGKTFYLYLNSAKRLLKKTGSHAPKKHTTGLYLPETNISQGILSYFI